MGDNTTVSIPSGVLQVVHPNQYYTALNGDLVPRSAGVATNEGGSIGDATRRWLNVYAKKFFWGDQTTTGLTLERDTADDSLKLSMDGTERYRWTQEYRAIEQYVATPINEGKIAWEGLGGSVAVNTTMAPIGSNIQIKTNGRPIVIRGEDSYFNPALSKLTGTPTATARGSINLSTGNKEIVFSVAEITGTVTHYAWRSSWCDLGNAVPVSILDFLIHGLAAGTYDFQLYAGVTSGSDTLSMNTSNLVIYEL